MSCFDLIGLQRKHGKPHRLLGWQAAHGRHPCAFFADIAHSLL